YFSWAQRDALLAASSSAMIQALQSFVSSDCSAETLRKARENLDAVMEATARNSLKDDKKFDLAAQCRSTLALIRKANDGIHELELLVAGGENVLVFDSPSSEPQVLKAGSVDQPLTIKLRRGA